MRFEWLRGSINAALHLEMVHKTDEIVRVAPAVPMLGVFHTGFAVPRSYVAGTLRVPPAR